MQAATETGARLCFQGGRVKRETRCEHTFKACAAPATVSEWWIHFFAARINVLCLESPFALREKKAAPRT
jgi:hypothetical protein